MGLNWLKLPPKRLVILGFISLILTISCGWLGWNYHRLQKAELGPVEGFWVLGGSIKREIYVAQLRKETPELPILISQGSKDPCILLIFEREKVAFNNVWLEKCSQNTFDNFYFGLPIIRQWGVHKVKLITSQSHLPRAKLMAEIILNVNGIALELEIVPETGVPGNQEYPLKTVLDVMRTILWSPFSQIIGPKCNKMTELIEVNLDSWLKQGFVCESQANLTIPHRKSSIVDHL
jgi:uncharacterized SAM-binding protein YcdF (DUF218 family)